MGDGRSRALDERVVFREALQELGHVPHKDLVEPRVRRAHGEPEILGREHQLVRGGPEAQARAKQLGVRRDVGRRGVSEAHLAQGEVGGVIFFSGNIASLSRVLSSVAEVQITEQERGGVTSQKIVYQLGR